jgi:hypothetical protein
VNTMLNYDFRDDNGKKIAGSGYCTFPISIENIILNECTRCSDLIGMTGRGLLAQQPTSLRKDSK